MVVFVHRVCIATQPTNNLSIRAPRTHGRRRAGTAVNGTYRLGSRLADGHARREARDVETRFECADTPSVHVVHTRVQPQAKNSRSGWEERHAVRTDNTTPRERNPDPALPATWPSMEPSMRTQPSMRAWTPLIVRGITGESPSGAVAPHPRPERKQPREMGRCLAGGLTPPPAWRPCPAPRCAQSPPCSMRSSSRR